MKEIVLGGVPKRSGASAPRRSGPAPKRGRPAPKRRRRRTGRQALNYLLLLIVAAVIMFTLSMTVLFQVKTVATDGLTKYAPQALIDASGVKEGDNLLRISERTVRAKILPLFPYIEDISLRRSLPDKLVLEVTEAQPLGACQTQDGYVVIGKTGRILETGASQPPDDVMVVYGMYLYEPSVGRVLGKFTKEQKEKLEKQRKAASEAASKAADTAASSKVPFSSSTAAPSEEEIQNPADLLYGEGMEEERESDAFNTLTDLVNAVEETGFSNITMVDMSDGLGTTIVYDGRVLIELGSVADLSYKLHFVSYVLENQPEGFEGTIDASYCTTSQSVVISRHNIDYDLEQLRLRAGGEPIQEEPSEDGTELEVSGSSEGPETKENDGNKSSSSNENSSNSEDQGSSSESATSEENLGESSSSRSGLYSPEELAVIPGPSSSQEENASEEGDSTQ